MKIIKTYKQWEESGIYYFNEFILPGDAVEEQLVQEFSIIYRRLFIHVTLCRAKNHPVMRRMPKQVPTVAPSRHFNGVTDSGFIVESVTTKKPRSRI